MIRRSDILFFLAICLGLYVAWLARDVLLLVYVSALFAVVVSPAVRAVQRIRIRNWRPSRGLSIIVILFCGLLLISTFAAFALPPIFRDVHAFAADWPKRSAEMAERVRNIPMLDRLNLPSFQQSLAGAAGGVVGLFAGLAGGVAWFFSWLVLTAYFIVDGDRAFEWLVSLLPPRHQSRFRETMLRAEARLRKWLVGQGILMLCLGAASAVVFGALRLNYFYALAVFAGAANIVPIVGPVASLVLACTVAAFDSGTKVLGVLIFYVVYQQIENAFLTPRVMKSTLDLPPLAVVIALSLGGTLAGVIGALVAVPTAALVAVLVDEYIARPNREKQATGARLGAHS